MIIEGVKMACAACVRGHRVSGCQHMDRKLQPVAKKGRPVSQCQHCRTMRKSRAAHVKCQCGAPKEGKNDKSKSSCAAASTAMTHVDVSTGGSTTPEDPDSKRPTEPPCPCGHGGRCTCASLKKEPQLDSVPELTAAVAPMGRSSAPPMPAQMPQVPQVPAITSADMAVIGLPQMPVHSEGPRKPRLVSTQSEGSLTTFANGHHKPTHKHHGNAHCSAPYSIPPVGHTGHNFGEHNGRVKASTAPSSNVSQTVRRIKSEHSSPDLRTYPALQLTNNAITPLELTPPPPKPSFKPSTQQMSRSASTSRMQPELSVNTNHPPFVYGSQESLPSASSEGFQLSAGLFPSESAGWPPPARFGQFDAGSFEDFSPQVELPYNQWGTVSQESFIAAISVPPALTNSTSGDEPEDLGAYPLNEMFSSNSSEQGTDGEPYHLSANSSFIGNPLVLTSEGNNMSISSTSTMPYETSMYADSSDFGVGSSVYAQSNISEEYLSQPEFTKAPGETGYVTPPMAPSESEGLWMAPYNPF